MINFKFLTGVGQRCSNGEICTSGSVCDNTEMICTCPFGTILEDGNCQPVATAMTTRPTPMAWISGIGMDNILVIRIIKSTTIYELF